MVQHFWYFLFIYIFEEDKKGSFQPNFKRISFSRIKFVFFGLRSVGMKFIAIFMYTFNHGRIEQKKQKESK